MSTDRRPDTAKALTARRPAGDPLAEVLRRAQRQTDDPATRRWLARLLEGEAARDGRPKGDVPQGGRGR